MIGFDLIFILLIFGLIAYVLGWRPQFANQVAPQENYRRPWKS